MAGITEQGLAANIAEYYGIPLAALHFFPAEILESSGPRGLAKRGLNVPNARHWAYRRQLDERRTA